jgi:hypothetical protein
MVTQRKRAALTEEYSHTLKRYESRSTDKNKVPQGLPEQNVWILEHGQPSMEFENATLKNTRDDEYVIYGPSIVIDSEMKF